jgi:hypothetical protein
MVQCVTASRTAKHAKINPLWLIEAMGSGDRSSGCGWDSRFHTFDFPALQTMAKKATLIYTCAVFERARVSVPSKGWAR